MKTHCIFFRKLALSFTLLGILFSWSTLVTSNDGETSDLVGREHFEKLGIKSGQDILPTLGDSYQIQEIPPGTLHRWMRFAVTNDSEKDSGPDELTSGQIRAGYFRYRHMWFVDDKENLIAESSIRWFRTARIYDGEGDYLGKIHKKYITKFTTFSGYHHYKLYDKDDDLVADGVLKSENNVYKIYLTARVKNKSNKPYDKTIVEYTKRQEYNKAHKMLLDYWDMDVKKWAIDEKVIGAGNDQIDPRLLMFVGPYSTLWDRDGYQDDDNKK